MDTANACKNTRFSGDGELIKSGRAGYASGQFHLPHGIAVAPENSVFVADRENDRIQIFDVEGNLRNIWENISRPAGICIKDNRVYVAELGHRMYADNVRPGRFDRRVVVARPDVKGREEILRVHTRKVPISDDVDLSIIARGTPGFSGADLANLVNEAALWAARQNRKFVLMVDFEMAKDKVLMGVERKSMILSDEEKKNTAYHEAGHALVAAMTPGADPVHKVTIIPRGMALGLTMQLPEADKHTYTKEYLEGMLAVLMGGRTAEEIFLGHITTGAGNDIERATDIARNMVCEWGMSEMGPLAYGKKEEAIFLGREIAQHRDFSEDTAVQIDKEVKRIVNEAYGRAHALLSDHRETLEKVALALLEREVLDAVEVKLLMEGKPLPEKPRTPPTPPPQGAPGTDPKVVRPELRPAPGFTRGDSPAKA